MSRAYIGHLLPYPKRVWLPPLLRTTRRRCAEISITPHQLQQGVQSPPKRSFSLFPGGFIIAFEVQEKHSS